MTSKHSQEMRNSWFPNRLGGLAQLVIATIALVAVSQPVRAGFATKLMFQLEIGDARSLPWGSDAAHGLAGYDVANLLRDAEALLTPRTPVIVRLETLRRAV